MLFEIGVVGAFVSLFFAGFGDAGVGDSPNKYDLLPCKVDSDCSRLRGHCVDSFCKCNNTFSCRLSEEQILVNKIGEICKSSPDCNMENAYCEKNICICQEGYKPSANKMNCLRIATRLGDECEEDSQCYDGIPSSSCQQNKCGCQTHMHEVDGSCYKDVGLGNTCQLIEECSITSHATCSNTKCECRENYVANGSICLMKANGLNFTCDADLQCMAQLGLGSKCSNGSCQCKDFFHFKASINQCVHDILLNEECGDHRDCHQPGTGPSRLECLQGTCKCKSPYLQEGDFCISSSTSVVLIRSIILFIGTMFLIV